MAHADIVRHMLSDRRPPVHPGDKIKSFGDTAVSTIGAIMQLLKELLANAIGSGYNDPIVLVPKTKVSMQILCIG